MILSFDIAGIRYRIDTSRPIDISIPLVFGGAQPNAFYLPRAEAESVVAGGFVGDTRRGGSCNCETVTLNPHGSGTHTESVGHISNQRLSISALLGESFIPAVLVTVAPEPIADGLEEEGVIASGDIVVTRAGIERAIEALGDLPAEQFGALVIRTLPNGDEKKQASYSGANPPYISRAAMRLVRELGVEHLLVDLPSLDREDDGGTLAGHRIFWGVEENGHELREPYPTRTITEMVFVDDGVADGAYILNLQVPPFMLDAAPSRPLLYRIEEDR